MDNKARAREILSKMTLEEKIGQVTQVSYNGQSEEEMTEIINRVKPGSLILCGSALGGSERQREVCLDAINNLQKVAVENTPSGVPIVFGRDIIHGHRVAFPVPLTMTASFDFDYIEECYNAIREEAINDGVKWTFAPMLDMSREHRWGRIVEGTGEDPYLGECFAKAAVKGFQTDDLSDERSMMACAKHFVGYGASEGGRDYNHTEISDYSLQNYYLPAFRAAVDSGLATVMSSFNEINGIPTSGDKRIMTEVLRNQMGFEGFVVSDWAAIWQMTAHSGFAENYREAARLSLEAGVDMDMVDDCYYKYAADLINSGELDEEVLDTSVLRILETKLRAGLFEHPYVERRDVDFEKHLEMSQRLAEKSIVLLKNENNILPLKQGTKVGVCGPMLRCGEELVGTWSCDYDATYSRHIFDCLSEKLDISEIRDSMFYRNAMRNSYEAVIAVLGEYRSVTGEATALADIGIPETQLELIRSAKRSGKPVIGVFCFARPISFGDADELFDAIIYAGHGGSRGAEAITSILLGEAEPEGRLPFTLPYHQGQLPLYYNALPGSRQINGYYDDIYIAHTNYCDCTGAPNYPFGYGLAYTEFTYSDICCKETEKGLDDIKKGGTFKLSVTVENSGEREGIAVPQLYVRDLFASRIRPLRCLRKFCKIKLQPGESKTVEFEISMRDLGFYLENGEFIVEKGDFDIFIGESSLATNKIGIKIS